VVDDESLSRKLLEEHICMIPFLELVGTCKHPYEAMEMLQEKQVDLMFLDIQMPGMLGTKFLQSLRNKPLVIFVTAYANYALESYDLDVVDYLMKPVSSERFAKAVQKAMEEKMKLDALANKSEVSASRSGMEDTIFVNVDYALVRININEITHIESMKDYVKIFTDSSPKPVITKSTLKAMEEKLPSSKFFRVHKSFIVRPDKIQSIRSQNITIGKHQIPVSDAYVDALMALLNQNK
jgi:DNA-binding LytR/AlgR family response regulator